MKDGKDPISFWSGDNSLKGKIKDVSGYNKEMALVYKRYSFVLIGTAFVSLINVIAGMVIITLDITVGIFIVYRRYKNILDRYS